MSTTVIETPSASTVIETDTKREVVESNNVPVLIETAAEQGPPGRDGASAMQISQEADNRLQAKPDGLYVADGFVPDPLAYYILAKG